MNLINSKIKRTFLLFICLAFIGNFASAQHCISFAKRCKSTLGEFIHDGNYNATILSEGETAELHKTFFEGQKYRISLCSVDELPNVQFRLLDDNNKVLFDNKDHNYSKIWDFTLETTQMLMIQIKVTEDANEEEILQGCVAILFGLESQRKRKK